MKNSVKSRDNQLINFSVIRETQPQAAYLPFANALRKKIKLLCENQLKYSSLITTSRKNN